MTILVDLAMTVDSHDVPPRRRSLPSLPSATSIEAARSSSSPGKMYVDDLPEPNFQSQEDENCGKAVALGR